jgi:peptidoglycan-N-acetylglucosamine deacetylase
VRWLSDLGKETLQGLLMRDAFVWRLSRASGCALTFDDGPDATYTPQVLELLGRHAIRATFFLIGEAALRAPELVRLIAQEGHGVASHGYSHAEFPRLTRAQLERELSGCRSVIRELTGIDTPLVRPPRGKVGPCSLAWIARGGYRLVHWSKTYSDYRRDGSAALLRRIRRQGLAAGDIALFHDNNAHTVAALAQVLPEWRRSGRTFAVLS